MPVSLSIPKPDSKSWEDYPILVRGSLVIFPINVSSSR